MTQTTSKGVKCGNKVTHGTDTVYHANAAAVRACYAQRYSTNTYDRTVNRLAHENYRETGYSGLSTDWDAQMQAKEQAEDERVAQDKLMRDLAAERPNEDARSEREARRADFGISHVPEGRYAVQDPKSGELRFVAITKGAEDGRWKNYTFAEVMSAGQHSLNAHKLGSNRPNGAKYYGKAHGMMRVLASMTDKEWNQARIRFGLELKYCGFHPGPLTNEKSRRLGYGETCARNNGLPY